MKKNSGKIDLFKNSRNNIHRLRLFLILLIICAVSLCGTVAFHRLPIAEANKISINSQQSGSRIRPVQGHENDDAGEIGLNAQRQMQALLDEKESRSPVAKKIASRLLFALKMSRGEDIAPGIKKLPLRPDMRAAVSSGELTLVDIRCQVSKNLIKLIDSLGGEVVSVVPQYNSIRARLPLSQLERVAGEKEVSHIRPAAIAYTQHQLLTAQTNLPIPMQNFQSSSLPSAKLREHLADGFATRAANVQAQLSTMLPRLNQTKLSDENPLDGIDPQIVNVSQGDVAHRADIGRATIGTTGFGVKIGVISDSVDFLADIQKAGDLGPVTVLPGQDGLGPTSTGEGTAMLEIVHDLAPNAQLFFATAFNGDASFAANIIALRNAGCDIIVDDVFYTNESPFQDGIIAQAVNTVTADGALYFSSAGNQGSKQRNNSACYEGDFVDGSPIPALPGSIVNMFTGGVNNDLVLSNSPFPATLFWSDPLGGSANDYDLFVLNSNLTAVIDLSTDIQDGDDDPYEETEVGLSANSRIVVVRKSNAAIRFLHLDTFFSPLSVSTSGQTKGHGSAVDAYSVAAINVASAQGGPFTGFNNPIEVFSSDGLRKIFYNADGSLANSNNDSLLADGGIIRQKPDIAAADGVMCATPGFRPFFGTSAASPHAAAIAGLLLSAKRDATPTQIRAAILSTALDTNFPGIDALAGAGIVRTDAALTAVGAQPQPDLQLGTFSAIPVSGNGNSSIEPGELVNLTVQLSNATGAVAATGLNATLSTTSPNVSIINATAAYPNIPVKSSASNSTPFSFMINANATCGQIIKFSIAVTNAQVTTPRILEFTVMTGQVNAPLTFSFSSAAGVAVPDNNETGIMITLPVSGVNGSIADIDFRFDGSSCSSSTASTTSGFTHSFVGDLVVTLISPAGTAVPLISNLTGNGLGNSGHNFCQTLLDDSAGPSIQSTNSAMAPFTGSFKPASPLSKFIGETANGNWKLKVVDNRPGDSGRVRFFSILISALSCGGTAAAPTSTTISGSPNPATFGQNFTATATVTSNGSPVTSGSVTFSEGAVTLAGPIALNTSGKAAFTVGNLSTGAHTITANYSGNASFIASSASYSQQVNVTTCPSITVNPTALAGQVAGRSFTTTISAVGGLAPYNFAVTAGTLPTGVTLSSSGSLSGSTSSGSYSFTITTSDANGCKGSRAYSLTVTCAAITLTPATLPAGALNSAYNQTLTATTGAAPFSFAIASGNLPAGLSLSSNGIISGTPTITGASSFVVRVTDAGGCSSTKSYSLTIGGCTTAITLSSISATAIFGKPYSANLTASGGVAPYTFTKISGSLPNGLTLSSTGILSGTPTLKGRFSFAIKATDSRGCSGTKTYLITVN